MKARWLVLLLAGGSLVGCSSQDAVVDSPDESSPHIVMDGPPPALDDPPHPEHGPHGGELVELGQEAYHIEMMHGSDHAVFYILDGTATATVAIEAESLTVSLKHDGEVKSFELPADPQSTDETGRSSRFTSEDPQVDQWLDAGAEGAVVLQINGKSFTGEFSHDHDHG